MSDFDKDRDVLNTRDIGFLVRDMLELKTDMVEHFSEDRDCELEGVSLPVAVDFVDVGDPHNPKLYLSNGQVFTIRIIAGDR